MGQVEIGEIVQLLILKVLILKVLVRPVEETHSIPKAMWRLDRYAIELVSLHPTHFRGGRQSWLQGHRASTVAQGPCSEGPRLRD